MDNEDFVILVWNGECISVDAFKALLSGKGKVEYVFDEEFAPSLFVVDRKIVGVIVLGPIESARALLERYMEYETLILLLARSHLRGPGEVVIMYMNDIHEYVFGGS